MGRLEALYHVLHTMHYRIPYGEAGSLISCPTYYALQDPIWGGWKPYIMSYILCTTGSHMGRLEALYHVLHTMHYRIPYGEAGSLISCPTCYALQDPIWGGWKPYIMSYMLCTTGSHMGR